jgi:hypothetical protein
MEGRKGVPGIGNSITKGSEVTGAKGVLPGLSGEGTWGRTWLFRMVGGGQKIGGYA